MFDACDYEKMITLSNNKHLVNADITKKVPPPGQRHENRPVSGRRLLIGVDRDIVKCGPLHINMSKVRCDSAMIISSLYKIKLSALRCIGGLTDPPKSATRGENKAALQTRCTFQENATRLFYCNLNYLSYRVANSFRLQRKVQRTLSRVAYPLKKRALQRKMQRA